MTTLLSKAAILFSPRVYLVAASGWARCIFINISGVRKPVLRLPCYMLIRLTVSSQYRWMRSRMDCRHWTTAYTTQASRGKNGATHPVDIMWAMMTVWRIKEKNIRTVLYCIVYDSCARQHIHVWTVLEDECWFRSRFIFSALLGLAFCVFWFSLDYFVLVLFAFVLLDLVSSVLRQKIAWEERLRNNLFCVKWDIKP